MLALASGLAVAAPDPDVGQGLTVGRAERGVVVGPGAASASVWLGARKSYASCCDGHLTATLGLRLGLARDWEISVAGAATSGSLFPTDPLDLGATWRPVRGRVEVAVSATSRIVAPFLHDGVDLWVAAGPIVRLHPSGGVAVEGRAIGLVPLRSSDNPHSVGVDAPLDVVIDVARSGFVAAGSGFEVPGRGEGYAVPVRGALGWTFARGGRPFVEVGTRASWRQFPLNEGCFECGPETSRVWDVFLGVELHVLPKRSTRSASLQARRDSEPNAARCRRSACMSFPGPARRGTSG